MPLHRLLEAASVTLAEQPNTATAFNTVGLVDAADEAHVAVALLAPLLLCVKLTSAARDVQVVVVVGHNHQ